jgi:cytochrome P450
VRHFSRLSSARAINEMRPSIRRTAKNRIEVWYTHYEVDFINEFAAKCSPASLPILGFSREDLPEFTLLGYEVTKVLSARLNPYRWNLVAAQRQHEYVGKVLRTWL